MPQRFKGGQMETVESATLCEPSSGPQGSWLFLCQGSSTLEFITLDEWPYYMNLWPPKSVSGFPAGSAVQNLSSNAGEVGLIPGSRKCPRRRKDPLQSSCLGKPMDRGAWRATVHGVKRIGHDWATKQQEMALSQMSPNLAECWVVRCAEFMVYTLYKRTCNKLENEGMNVGGESPTFTD